MRRSPTIRLLVVTVLAVALCSSTAALAAVSSSSGLAGTWAGKYSGAYSGTFRLHWTLTPSRLRGAPATLRGSITLSNPRGSYRVTGSINRGAIKFGTVGAGATYTGSVFRNKLGGSYQSPGGGGTWSAHKVIILVRSK
jgi:hypothetical protein